MNNESDKWGALVFISLAICLCVVFTAIVLSGNSEPSSAAYTPVWYVVDMDDNTPLEMINGIPWSALEYRQADFAAWWLNQQEGRERYRPHEWALPGASVERK